MLLKSAVYSFIHSFIYLNAYLLISGENSLSNNFDQEKTKTKNSTLNVTMFEFQVLSRLSPSLITLIHLRWRVVVRSQEGTELSGLQPLLSSGQSLPLNSLAPAFHLQDDGLLCLIHFSFCLSQCGQTVLSVISTVIREPFQTSPIGQTTSRNVW